MTDGGVHTTYYFIKPLGSGQTEPLHLDFSYHLEPLYTQPRRDPGCMNSISPALLNLFSAALFSSAKTTSCPKAMMLQSPETAGATEDHRSYRRSPQLLM
jgi:hypothetical protein